MHGEVTISGAKNSALPVMAASLLTADKVTLHNIPKVRDLILCQDLGDAKQHVSSVSSSATPRVAARRPFASIGESVPGGNQDFQFSVTHPALAGAACTKGAGLRLSASWYSSSGG